MTMSLGRKVAARGGLAATRKDLTCWRRVLWYRRLHSLDGQPMCCSHGRVLVSPVRAPLQFRKTGGELTRVGDVARYWGQFLLRQL